DCVVSLENGEEDPVQASIPHAGELYLEAMMWGTAAAESLFGEPGRAPARSGTRADTAPRHVLHAPGAARSKAPPGSAPSGLEAPTAVGPGFFARLWAGLRGLFGGRVSE